MSEENHPPLLHVIESNRILLKVNAQSSPSGLDSKNAMDIEKSEVSSESKIPTQSAETDNVDSDKVIVTVASRDVEKLRDDESMSKSELSEWLLQIGEIDETNISEKLKHIPNNKLSGVLKELEGKNSYISKENEVYEFVLNQDETIQSSLVSVQESFELTYPLKCHFAQKKLEHLEKELELSRKGCSHDLQSLKFDLESLNKSLEDLEAEKLKFNNIRIDGRHPVTNKVMLQRVMKYLNDSIQNKMDLANRYKVQIQGDTADRNKILNQISAQEKKLSLLDISEFEETQFEHKKIAKELAIKKEQLAKFKAKYSFLSQKNNTMKKNIEKEENDMVQMKNSVSKLEHCKEIMLTEKWRTDKSVAEMKVATRKIKLDPRRHDLPEVVDYAAAKRENASLNRQMEKWRNKVKALEQEKLLYVSALSKKKKY